MGVLRWLVVVAVAVFSWYVAVQLLRTPPLPVMDPNPWWGAGEPREQNTNIRPFKIEVSQQDLDDLNARLALPSRLTPSLEGTNFTYGFNSAAMSVILKYWKDNYDWRKREQRLNSIKQFKTRIEGLDIHFVRSTPAAGSGKIVRPLLMVHGWPGSFVEFYDIIPLLTTPRPDSDVVFDVICPSLPGYGFSSAATKPGMNTAAMAQIFMKLMSRLGFEQFYAQGGDWGSAVTTDLATLFPEKVIGLHLNMAMGLTLGSSIKITLGSILPSGFVMDPTLESKWYPLSSFYGMIVREMGYMHLHATKPDTVGVALNTSPQGLAAYILEKFSTWTDMDNIAKKDGGLLDPHFPISLDRILDNICVYWFTSSITSSMRLYAEFFDPSSPAMTLANIPTPVPTGLAACTRELAVLPRNIVASKYTNLITYSNLPAGHFAAMEAPKIIADDILNFANTLERTLKADSEGATQGGGPAAGKGSTKKEQPKKTKK